MRVEAHDLHTNGAGPAALDLVLVPEEIDARLAATVVQVALDEHAQHGALAGVDYMQLLISLLLCCASIPT